MSQSPEHDVPVLVRVVLAVRPDPAPGEHPRVTLTRDITTHLPAALGSADLMATTVYGDDVPPELRDWSQHHFRVAGHYVMITGTPDPLLPTPTFAVAIDGYPVPYQPTDTRPLAEVLADAVAAGITPR